MKGKYFLELFAGSGAVSRALARLGFECRSFEIEKGEQEDLTRAKTQQTIAGEISNKKVLGAMISPPCQTWGPAGNRSMP